MSENEKGPEGIEAVGIAVFWLALIAIVLISIPVMLLGQVWAGAYLDRREGRRTRFIVATLILFGAMYFLFGLPGRLVDPAQFVFGRRSLDTPTTYEWIQGFWQGLFYERLWPDFQEFYHWVISKPKRGQPNLHAFYNLVRVSLYFASGCVPLAGMFFISNAAWVKAWIYRGVRYIFIVAVSPLAALPIQFAQKGRTLLATAVLFVQPIVATLFAAFLIWIFADKGGPETVYMPLTVFYVATGTVYGLYLSLRVGVSAQRVLSELKNPDLIHVGVDLQSGSRIALTIEQLQHHLQVVGASGFGKSTFLSHIYRHHIRNGLGLLFVDLKADTDTVAEITTLCQNAGRLSDLRILDLSNPELSISYNPCKRGNPTETKDKIVGALAWDNEYYKNAAQSFLLTLLNALIWLRDNKKTAFTLDDLHQATLSPDALIALGTALNEALAPVDIREDIQELASYLRTRENWKELHGLRTQLKMLLDSEFGSALKSDKPGIDFFEAIAKKQIVYVLLDSQTYGETAKVLGKLILQDLKSCSGEIVTKIPKSERTHCTIIVDEFADLATEQFVGFLSRARGSKLGVCISHQEIADLEAISTAMRDQVMTNTSTTVSFLQKSPESAERISKLAGTRATTARTRQVVEEQGIFFTNRHYSGVESERDTLEYNIHPDEVKSLSRGQCVMVGKIPHAWHANKVSIYAPENLAGGVLAITEVVELLKAAKEAVESEPTGMIALQLRRRSREFTDEVNQRPKSQGNPGLRTEPAMAEVGAVAMDADDRF